MAHKREIQAECSGHATLKRQSLEFEQAKAAGIYNTVLEKRKIWREISPKINCMSSIVLFSKPLFCFFFFVCFSKGYDMHAWLILDIGQK